MLVMALWSPKSDQMQNNDFAARPSWSGLARSPARLSSSLDMVIRTMATPKIDPQLDRKKSLVDMHPQYGETLRVNRGVQLHDAGWAPNCGGD